MPNKPTQPQVPPQGQPQHSTEQQLVMFLQSLEQQVQDLAQRVDVLEGKSATP